MRSNLEAVRQLESRGRVTGVDKAVLSLISPSGTTDEAVLSALEEHRAQRSLKRFAEHRLNSGHQGIHGEAERRGVKRQAFR